MKRFLLASFSAIAAITTFTVSSCKVDKCKAIVCANGGTCETDGSCTCPSGYEGERCETVTRDRYKGAWTVTEDGTVSSVARYVVSVENNSNLTSVQIRNFNNQNNAVVVANIVKDSIYIPTQTYTVGTLTKTVVGYGVITPEKFYEGHGELKMYYRVSSSDGVVDNYGYQGSGNASLWTK